MYKLLLTILLVTFSASSLFAQRERDGDKFEEIQTIKIGYITKKLNLSSKQAKRFWPIYNKYETEHRQLRRTFVKQYRKNNPNVSHHEARTFVNANIDYQEQKIELRKKFTKSLNNILSDQQITNLFIAEQEFKQMLIKRLRGTNRHNGKPQGGRR